jgi:hypothetical protein
LERQRAEARVEELADEGYIRDEAERERRLREVRAAYTQAELNAAVEGLEAEQPKLKDADRRAATGDKGDAIRRLQAHVALGHLDEKDLAVREDLVKHSRTPNDIARAFDDLPELTTIPRSAAPRISTRDRMDALRRLDQAKAEGRINEDELVVAEAQVDGARTQAELDAAFRGLPGPTRTEMAANMTKQAAVIGGRVAIEGGRRARNMFLRFLFAGALLMFGIIFLVAGLGIAAVVCFVLAVVLFVAAGMALVSGRRS